MTTLRTKSGITDAEWTRTTVDEARSDPVGMWRIVRAGREGFALVGGDLEDFVHRFIAEMIKAGAAPVIGDITAPFGWSPVLKYGEDPTKVADALVREWLASKSDPDVDGIWFAFQAVWK